MCCIGASNRSSGEHPFQELHTQWREGGATSAPRVAGSEEGSLSKPRAAPSLERRPEVHLLQVAADGGDHVTPCHSARLRGREIPDEVGSPAAAWQRTSAAARQGVHDAGGGAVLLRHVQKHARDRHSQRPRLHYSAVAHSGSVNTAAVVAGASVERWRPEGVSGVRTLIASAYTLQAIDSLASVIDTR